VLFEKADGGILRLAELLPAEQEILARLEDVDRDNTRQLRRHDSEIDSSFAITATGRSPSRTRSTARCRNSGG
jgi:hypothetical protein